MGVRHLSKVASIGHRLPAFIDFEASGLGFQSWPIEVGWALPDGAAQSALIRPVDHWPDSGWDPAAEALHGISRQSLEQDDFALPVEVVCKRLTAALSAYEVFSDAPDWDGFWLGRLYAAIDEKPPFKLLDFSLLMPPLDADPREELFVRADALAPRQHRAGADALHLQTLYRLAQNAPPLAPRVT